MSIDRHQRIYRPTTIVRGTRIAVVSVANIPATYAKEIRSQFEYRFRGNGPMRLTQRHSHTRAKMVPLSDRSNRLSPIAKDDVPYSDSVEVLARSFGRPHPPRYSGRVSNYGTVLRVVSRPMYFSKRNEWLAMLHPDEFGRGLNDKSIVYILQTHI